MRFKGAGALIFLVLIVLVSQCTSLTGKQISNVPDTFDVPENERETALPPERSDEEPIDEEPLVQQPTEQPECPSLCNDGDNCTIDYCNSSSSYLCAYAEMELCCGNGKCELGELEDCRTDCNFTLDLCNGVVCQDSVMQCEEGEIRCSNSCIDGECTTCSLVCPQVPDACEGIVCESGSTVCPDGFTAECENLCVDGTCSECTPDCSGHEGPVCGDGICETGEDCSQDCIYESGRIIINEIMYDLNGSDEGREWIEIKNTDNVSINISNWIFEEDETQHRLTLVSGNMILQVGDFAVIVDDVDVFNATYAFNGNLIDSSFSLSNTGESLVLRDSRDATVMENITYSESWGGNGTGKSIERNSSGWNESLIDGGTPGYQNSLI